MLSVAWIRQVQTRVAEHCNSCCLMMSLEEVVLGSRAIYSSMQNKTLDPVGKR